MEDTLGEILTNLGAALGEFVPRLVGAVVVMLLALVAAIMLQRLMARLLEAIGLDEIAGRTGATNSLRQLGYGGGPSDLLGLIIFWGVLITGVAGALSVLGLSSLEQTMDQVVTLAGRALVAFVILIAGVTAAGGLADQSPAKPRARACAARASSGAPSSPRSSPWPVSWPPASSASRPQY